ncbi:hypothetical protein [Microbaculum marinum]|uniref:MFS transporter n=1 Tax=Microbaculum marinum TaxID=1764581 RepID=A0AAW9RZT6_9HYPH
MTRSFLEPNLIGIISLSSIGSVPLHLSTIWIERLSGEDGFTYTEANAALSAYFLGQIIAAAVPVLRPVRLTGRVVLVLSVLLVSFLSLSNSSASPPALLLVWLLVGLCCGGLIYAGFRAASDAANVKRVFAVRLSISLVVSGVVAFLIYVRGDQASYPSAILTMIVVLVAIILLSARNASKAEWSDRSSDAALGPAHLNWRSVIALTTIFVLFAGQIAFLANAGLYIATSTSWLNATSLATAVAKGAVGILLMFAFFIYRKWSGRSVLVVVGALIASILAMYSGKVFVIVVAGFVLFELSFNILSSIMFGDVSDRTSGYMQRMILFSALAGGFAGPFLAGLFLDRGLEFAPVAMALTSAVVVLSWRKLAVAD